MIIPSVLTQPIVEEEILPTPMGTHGPKIRITEMITVDKEALDLKEIEAGLWIS